MNSEEDVVLVILAIEKRLQPQRPEFLIKLLYLSLKFPFQTLVILSLIEFQKFFCLIDFINKLLPGIITIFQCIEILESLLCLLRIIPEIGSSSLFLYRFYLIFCPGLFKDASRQYRLLL